MNTETKTPEPDLLDTACKDALGNSKFCIEALVYSDINPADGDRIAVQQTGLWKIIKETQQQLYNKPLPLEEAIKNDKTHIDCMQEDARNRAGWLGGHWAVKALKVAAFVTSLAVPVLPVICGAVIGIQCIRGRQAKRKEAFWNVLDRQKQVLNNTEPKSEKPQNQGLNFYVAKLVPYNS